MVKMTMPLRCVGWNWLESVRVYDFKIIIWNSEVEIVCVTHSCANAEWIESFNIDDATKAWKSERIVKFIFTFPLTFTYLLWWYAVSLVCITLIFHMQYNQIWQPNTFSRYIFVGFCWDLIHFICLYTGVWFCFSATFTSLPKYSINVL